MQTNESQKTEKAARGRRDTERGAALITVVLISTLLLAAGGALILVTATSASNAADATAEAQAYYAAEAGIQQVVGVLRGNVAPDPLFNSTLTNEANMISLRRAVNPATSNTSGTGPARLTRWLDYDATYTDRVVLTTSYVPISGMAYGVDSVVDPDFSDTVTFSVSGVFNNNDDEKNYGNGGNGFTLTYAPRTTTTLPTGGNATASTLGTFTISSANGSYTLNNEPFTLTITQTKPWPMTTKIECRIDGVVQKIAGNVISTLLITFPKPAYFVGGSEYEPSFIPATRTIAILSNGAQTMNVTVTPPEPLRLLVRVRGFGPRNAVKMMQALIGRSAFGFSATSAITLRSDDDDTDVMQKFDPGASSQYVYDGNDNSGGPPLPAFSVTNTADYNLVNGLIGSNGQSIGSAPVQKVPISALTPFLQSVAGPFGARQAVQTLRTLAKNQLTPGCTPPSPSDTSTCDRYFSAGQTPGDLGKTHPNGLLTFVDGDVDIPPQGGRGMLVVTGTLTLNGSSDFAGLVLVLGEGKVIRQGGGGDTSLGAIAVARFDNSSDKFLQPYFDSNGGGTSAIRFDAEWVRRALGTTGPGVLAISEY
ncbi:MAG TPA: hypothetical protein VGX48_04840 [Pyrinomonadaceae bacterium]|jgi:hypothetical protein|nr:hypothetical protein [Pyrinomonadaceae bacterium]